MSSLRRHPRASSFTAALVCFGCAAGRVTSPTTTPTMVTFGGAVGGRSGVTLNDEMGYGQTTFAQRVSSVWGVMPGVFRQLDIEATVVNAADGMIGNPRFQPRRIENRRLSSFLDCGSGLTGDNADLYQVTMMIQVQLIAASDSTVVQTTVDAYADPRSVSANSMHCRSRGSLERRVGEIIAERLASQGPAN